MRSDELFWFWFGMSGLLSAFFAIGMLKPGDVFPVQYRRRRLFKKIGILLIFVSAALLVTGLGMANHVRKNWERPFYSLVESKAALAPASEWDSIRPTPASDSNTIRSTSFLGIDGVDAKYHLNLIPPADELYIRRRLIVVERDKKGRIDVDLIPSDLQPLTPEQVGTIAYVDQQRFSDASYTHGGQFYSREFRLTFVDVNTNRVIGVVQFCSPKEAPGAMEEGADKTIEPEKGDIVKYIKSLRRID
jgi:hypothetical protein